MDWGREGRWSRGKKILGGSRRKGYGGVGDRVVEGGSGREGVKERLERGMDERVETRRMRRMTIQPRPPKPRSSSLVQISPIGTCTVTCLFFLLGARTGFKTSARWNWYVDT